VNSKTSTTKELRFEVHVSAACAAAPFFRIDRGRTAKAATALSYENKDPRNVYFVKPPSPDVLRETINRVTDAGSRMAKPRIAHQANENTENSIQDDKRSIVDAFSANSRVETDR
jgi:hypothetical protein